MNEKAVLIFTTGIADYLEEGYEVAALRYLRKPLRREKVWECLDMAAERHVPESFLVVNTEEEMNKLAIEKINYMEAVADRHFYCVQSAIGNGKAACTTRCGTRRRSITRKTRKLCPVFFVQRLE